MPRYVSALCSLSSKSPQSHEEKVEKETRPVMITQETVDILSRAQRSTLLAQSFALVRTTAGGMRTPIHLI